MNIVLVEPEIPPNTGNIARTCAATGVRLHLVHPLGFSVDEKHVRRAGLDYWNMLAIEEHENWDSFAAKYSGERMYFATTKTEQSYTDVAYKRGDFLVFGKETKGLPVALLKANWNQCITIPMIDVARSLNLSNAVAIVLYEAMRQLEFKF